MHDIPNDILKKLRKLIEHEKSAREIGSLAEADAFAAKVSELCDRYRIAVSEVPEAQRADDIAEADWLPTEADEKQQNRRSSWQITLGGGIAHGHFCRLLVFRGLNDLRFVGASADVEVAKAMMTILCRAAREACRRERSRNPKTAPNRFLFGFAIAINSRYRQQRADQEAQHPNATTALVRQTERLIGERYGKIRAAKAVKPPQYDESLQRGFDAGMQADLKTRLLTGEQPEPKRLEAAQ